MKMLHEINYYTCLKYANKNLMPMSMNEPVNGGKEIF